MRLIADDRPPFLGVLIALRMPEHTAFAVGYRRVFGRCDGLFDGEILVIARENLKGVRAVHIKADKVLEDIQKPFFFKNTLKKVSN